MNAGNSSGWKAAIPVNPYIGESHEVLAAKQRIVSRRIAAIEAELDAAIVADDSGLKTALRLQRSMFEDRLRQIEEALG